MHGVGPGVNGGDADGLVLQELREQVHESDEALVQAVSCRGVVDPSPSCEVPLAGLKGTVAAPALVSLGAGRAATRLGSVRLRALPASSV
eukprot:1189316-Pyramimonas_sp.AAC.1